MSIKLRAVSKIHKKKVILSRIAFDISDGEIVLIKSDDDVSSDILLKIIGGTESFSNGSITISGYDISDMNYKERADFYRNTIGFFSYNFQFQKNLNVRDNISLPGVFSNLPKREIKSRTERITKKYKINDILKNKVTSLSHEQAEKVCIARTLFMNPKIILISGSNTENSETAIKHFIDYAKKEKATIIISSSNEFFEKYATKNIFIKNGKIGVEK